MFNFRLIDIYNDGLSYAANFPLDSSCKCHEFECTRCKIKVSSLIEKKYVLEDYSGVGEVCAKCAYELHIRKSKQDLETIHRKEDKSLLDNYLFNLHMRYENFSNKTDYSYEDIKNLCEFNPKKIVSPYNLIGVSTGNNNAIAFGDKTNHVEFMFSNRGKNPYIYYNLCKEIYNNFNNFKSFDDYLYKLISCIVLGAWERTDNYNCEINKLTEEIRNKFDNSFELEGFIDNYDCDISNEEDILAKKLVNDFYSRLLGVGYVLKDFTNDEEKESFVDSWIYTFEELDKGRYECDGKVYKVDEIIYSCIKGQLLQIENEYISIEDALTTVSMEMDTIMIHYSAQTSLIYFEAWKLKKKDEYLKKCLSTIKDSLYTIYTGINYYNDEDFIGPKGEKSIEILECIVANLSRFYEKNKDAIREVNKMEKISIENFNRVNTMLYLDINFDKDSKLTPDAVLLHLINISPIYYMVYTILSKLTIEYNNMAKNFMIDDEDVELCEELLNKIAKIYTAVNNKVWEGIEHVKKLFGDDERAKIASSNNNSNKKFLYIIDEITSMLESLLSGELDDVKTKEKINEVSIKRSSCYSLNDTNSELDEELENSLQRFLKVLILVISRGSGELFSQVCEELRKELKGKDKDKYISESVFNTLATGEYLYKLFDIENELENIKNGKEVSNKDYSCISIMYYKALEDLLNDKVYVPYKAKYLGVLNNLSSISKNTSIEDYLPENPSLYYKYDKGSKLYYLPPKFMIGNFGYLFAKTSYRSNLKDFLKNELRVEDNVLSPSNSPSFNKFGKELKYISGNRNTAAHGGNVSIHEVKLDKENTYLIEESGKIKQYKGLIFDFLDFLP